MMLIYTLALFFIVFVYSVLITVYAFVLLKFYRTQKINAPDLPLTTITVVVALRNEEHNIRQCILSLANQNYPSQFFEVILVNDHSTDNSLEEIHKIIKEVNVPFSIYSLNDTEGKKSAICKGVKYAKNKLIALTDADCVVNENWLKSISDTYALTHANMILGTVVFENNTTVFQKIQSLELLSYQGVTISSTLLKNPILANGANIAYERDKFLEFEKEFSESKTASGDDVFLLHLFKKKYAVAYNSFHSGIVKTQATKTLKEFIEQRKRWISKSTKYTDSFAIINSGIVFISNLLLTTGMIISLFNPDLIRIVCILFLVKTSVDFFFLYLVTKITNHLKLLWLVAPLQVFYIFYIPIVSLLAFNSTFNWKGRIYKK